LSAGGGSRSPERKQSDSGSEQCALNRTAWTSAITTRATSFPLPLRTISKSAEFGWVGPSRTTSIAQKEGRAGAVGLTNGQSPRRSLARSRFGRWNGRRVFLRRLSQVVSS
jgi:hypothetical protein